MFMFIARGVVLFAIFPLILFVGCSPTRNIYREVMKDEEPNNTRIYQTSVKDLHKAVARTLLAKKFVIDNEDPEAGTLTASRFFSKSYQNVVVAVQSKIMSKGEKEQQLFLNAVQTTERNYVADKTRYFLFVVPLPGGGGKEVTKSKESELVIEDKVFYEELFSQIEKNIEK